MPNILIAEKQLVYYNFPDDAPTDSIDKLKEYVENHPEAKGDWGFFLNMYDEFHRELGTME